MVSTILGRVGSAPPPCQHAGLESGPQLGDGDGAACDFVEQVSEIPVDQRWDPGQIKADPIKGIGPIRIGKDVSQQLIALLSSHAGCGGRLGVKEATIDDQIRVGSSEATAQLEGGVGNDRFA
jgi:hypothetical protein